MKAIPILILLATLAWSSRSEEAIVFASSRGSSLAGIYRVNPDGTNLQRLSPGVISYGEETPSVSPDGKWIAFTRVYNGLWKMKPDGSDRTLVTAANGAGDQGSDWSPDGEWILYQSNCTCCESIYKVHPDGTGNQLLLRGGTTFPEPIAFRVSWSVLGRLTAVGFTCGANYGRLYSMNTDGSGVQLLLDNVRDVRSSPDGTQLVLERFNSSPNTLTIWTCNSDGTNLTQLTAGHSDYSPDWSPNGSYIVFCRSGKLWTMKADGSDQQQITFGGPGTSDNHPVWVNLYSEESPVVNCPTNVVAESDEGNCSSLLSFSISATGVPEPEVTYTVGGQAITSSHAFPVGTTVVTSTATNVAGSASCSFTVTVTDNQPPTIAGPSNINVRPTSLAGAIVHYDLPVAADNCPDVSVRQTEGLPAGSMFPIGATVNTFVATDHAGLEATHSFSVTVADPYCSAKKVYVCHNGNTICISENALPAHLAHGDLLGPCNLGKQGSESAYIPDAFALHDNYPNPFNPSTTIQFSLPVDEKVSLKVFNTVGEIVATLVDEKLPAGIHSRTFDAGHLASGVYFYRLQAGEFVSTRKLILLR